MHPKHRSRVGWALSEPYTVEPLYSARGHRSGMKFIERWPYLRSCFVLEKHFWDSAKCPLIESPHARGGLYGGFPWGNIITKTYLKIIVRVGLLP